MEEQALVIRTLIVHCDPQRFATVRARCLDLPILMQGGANAKSIPGAVSEPPSSGGVNPVCCRDAGERVRHPDSARHRVENKRVPGMKPLPAGNDLRAVASRGSRYFVGGGRAAKLDKERECDVAQH